MRGNSSPSCRVLNQPFMLEMFPCRTIASADEIGVNCPLKWMFLNIPELVKQLTDKRYIRKQVILTEIIHIYIIYNKK